MSERPTPGTDRITLLLENLDKWIDDALRNSKPIGRTLCAARSTIADHRARITEMWDALETLRRERDEAISVANDLASAASHCLGWHDCRLNIGEKIANTLQRWSKLKEVVK